MNLIDSHCHLDGVEFELDLDAVIERALDAGVIHMLAVGTGNGPPDYEAGIRLAERYSCLYATAGVHPHEAAKGDGKTMNRLRELLDHPKVVALGEIGLDYHYNFSPPEKQREIFAGQLAVAREASKPVIIHTREAWDDTVRILEQHWAPHGIGGIMHCFTGGPWEAERAVRMGFHLGFGGVITFPKAFRVREAAAAAPADRILLETDSPYLAPVPHRGKRNEPALILETARKLASVRKVTVEEVARQTTDNFRRLCLPGENNSG